MRRPFWLPGPGYYLLVAIFGTIVMFSVWGILQEADEAFSALLALASGVVVILLAILIREVFLRRARDRYLMLRRQLDESILSAKAYNSSAEQRIKISTKQNADFVRRIKKKSDAARELGGISKGHLEVFELCSDYLSLNRQQIDDANPGSPRLKELREGREFVSRLHHYHLLAWAQIECTALTGEAAACDILDGKFRHAREALGVLKTALQHYPSDPALRDSELAVNEFISSLQIKNWMEVADRQASAGSFSDAALTLEQALKFVEDSRSAVGERELVRERLQAELQRLSSQAQLAMGSQKYRNNSEND